jgi:hypothetical protein
MVKCFVLFQLQVGTILNKLSILHMQNIFVTITLWHIASATCKWALPFHRNMLHFILHIYRVSYAVDVTVLFYEQQNPHIDLNEVWTQNPFNESVASYLKPEVPLPLIIKCRGSKGCHLQTIRKVKYLHYNQDVWVYVASNGQWYSLLCSVLYLYEEASVY